MLSFVLRRVVAGLLTLLGVLIATFSLLYVMPGDPVLTLAGSFQGGVSAAELNDLRHKFGLDASYPDQFVHYLGNVFQGDFGNSILQGSPVRRLVLEALPDTLELAGLAFAIGAVLGVAVGVTCAVRRGRWIDRVLIIVSLLGVSMPDFWMAMMAVFVFAVKLAWFPSFGVGGMTFLILPATVLGVRSAAAIARVTRSSMLDILTKQYVSTARAKGLTDGTIIGIHALRNALIPVVTLLGLEFGRLIGGAVVVETVFSRNGIGTLLIKSILDKDVPVLRATVLLVAAGYVILNIIVDLSYGWLDPRVRAT